MEFEIDFLAVGEGEKSGDAIALRFGDLSGSRDSQVVMVVDGGTKESGQSLVNHIIEHYHTDRIDHVISTHPDTDHASGLTVVLEKMKVGNLLMHQPWDHATDILSLFKNGKLTASGLENNLQEALQAAHDLKSIADQKKIPVVEPFAGLQGYNGLFHVLGPSEAYYQAMLPHFRETPEPKRPIGILEKFIQPAKDVVEWVAETMDIETLDDNTDHFSAENSSSTILLLTIGNYKLLLTGDADIGALNAAADYAQSQGIILSDLHLLHVPHHGSKNNVGGLILNRIRARISQISAGLESPKHPSRKVVNALIRRGSDVYSTQGKSIRHTSPAVPPRPKWEPAQKLSFFDLVEA